MKPSKKRYSVPAKLVDLLFADDSFFNDVTKIKKASASSRFPKTDQWASKHGFNMFFALAGYSLEDISIETYRNTITIRSDGMEEEKYTPPAPSENDDAFESYSKGTNPIMHTGYVSRGIARRSFDVRYLISEEFDVLRVEAYMQDGLLHIFVPNSESDKEQEFRVISISEKRKR
jgi:HSP20 family molecular chaperone IbpA